MVKSKAAALALLCAIVPLASAADPSAPSPQDVDAARVLREAAANAAEKKDFATCKTKAAESFARAKQPQSVGLQGVCEAELKQWRDAAEHLSYAAQFDPNASRVADYKAKLADAKTRVGTLEVKTVPDACELKVDDRPIGQSPRDVFVNPGRYRVTAEAKGYDSKTVEIEITVGQTKPLAIELTATATTSSAGGGGAATTTGAGGAVSTGSGAVEPPSNRPVWPIGLGYGLAALGLGVGIGTTVAANAAPDFDCEGLQCADGDAYVERQETLSNAAFWSFIAGGTVALATTGYLIWVVTAPKGKPPTALLVPFASPTFGGATVLGRF